MPRCQYTKEKYDYENGKYVDFNCPEEALSSGFCIFHDKDYLQDKTNYEEHKRKVINRLKYKVSYAISNNESLLCIGFKLPDFSISDLSISKKFTKPVYFSSSLFFGLASFSGAHFEKYVRFTEAHFQGRVQFSEAEFEGITEFSEAHFQGEADFNHSEFYRKTYFSAQFNGETTFHYVLFEGKEKVIFDVENLSNVSFMNTDLTGVRFSDKARWGIGDTKEHKFKIAFLLPPITGDRFSDKARWRGGKKAKEDKFKIIDERLLEKEIEEKDGHPIKGFNLGSIKAVYRSLRENYEYRMRYDEAGQFFVREMELKRKYREVISKEEGNLVIKQNNWFRRNLFSLTGWYYHLSRYGESLWRPTVAGIIIILLSTLFWLIQINQSGEPSFINTVGFANATKITVWQRAFERSMADFLPILSMEEGVKVGIIDYVIKIVGGAVTFGLIAIALRRRFERRYRH